MIRRVEETPDILPDFVWIFKVYVLTGGRMVGQHGGIKSPGLIEYLCLQAICYPSLFSGQLLDGIAKQHHYSHTPFNCYTKAFPLPGTPPCGKQRYGPDMKLLPLYKILPPADL